MGGGSGVDLNPFNSPIWKPQGTKAIEQTTQAAGAQQPGMFSPTNMMAPVDPFAMVDAGKQFSMNETAGGMKDIYDAEQQRERQAAEQAAKKKNADYLASQSQMQAGEAEMDALTRARNAARKAKGQGLFGAWEA